MIVVQHFFFFLNDCGTRSDLLRFNLHNMPIIFFTYKNNILENIQPSKQFKHYKRNKGINKCFFLLYLGYLVVTGLNYYDGWIKILYFYNTKSI